MAAPEGRIDVHHHVLPIFYQEAQRAGGITGTSYRPFPEWSPEHGIRMMDLHTIATAILSFSSPGMYYGDVSAARDLTVRCNDYLAELVAERPTRFGENFPKGARHYFEQLYYDVALCGHPTPLAALQGLADPSKILFGTDFPYIPDDKIAAEVAGVDSYTGFDAESRPLMERENSLRLFPRLAG